MGPPDHGCSHPLCFGLTVWRVFEAVFEFRCLSLARLCLPRVDVYGGTSQPLPPSLTPLRLAQVPQPQASAGHRLRWSALTMKQGPVHPSSGPSTHGEGDGRSEGIAHGACRWLRVLGRLWGTARWAGLRASLLAGERLHGGRDTFGP